MPVTNDIELKSIIARRDRRYDGRFYFGVKTTRIYCRPTCPARPKPENIVIFKSASEAENSGYRPCLRCRPELAPGTKLLDGTENTVARALRIIDDQSGLAIDVETLAAKLGVTSRHLRRLFDQHLGASPLEVMLTQRLHFAKQLLQETTAPITDSAFAAGFSSVRRFNEAFKSRYRQVPSAFRKARATAVPQDILNLRLAIHSPYDWNSVLSYLRRHESHGVELVATDSYQRFVPTAAGFGTIAVTHRLGHDYLSVALSAIPLFAVRSTLTKLKNLFDTDHNPADLPSTAALDPQGIRVPASYEPFETAVGVILGQLVSTENAKATVKKLVEAFGIRLGTHNGYPIYAFPTPQTLATAAIETIGLTRVKSGAIRALASAVAEQRIDFATHGDFEAVAAALLAIKGIGLWTATMIAMRCFRNPDAFPATDLIIQRALEQGIIDATTWASSRSYLAHCVWRDHGAALTKTRRTSS